MAQQLRHVAVIGAGVVGVSCALWLQKKGLRVTLLDGNPPGSVTSFGNACTIADYGCVPVNDPGLIRRLPALLLRRESPLSLDAGYALSHLPWLLRFLRHCTRSEVDRITRALGRLLRAVNDGLDPLIETTRSGDLFSDRGIMYVYETADAFAQARANNRARADNGARMTELNAAEIRDLEPQLKPRFAKGFLFDGARQVLNPQSLVTRYLDTFTAQQGSYRATHVDAVAAQGREITLALRNGKTLSADTVVISSGAFSRRIRGAGTARLPLDTERGYHVQFADRQSLLTRPVSWAEKALYATPMDSGLRVAGTVEIAGLGSDKNPRNLRYLTRHAKLMLELPEEPESDWLGYRPTMPDALPVIGPSRRSPHILYAFGHQHLGLTLAGITGRLIAELANGEPPSLDISEYSAARFG